MDSKRDKVEQLRAYQGELAIQREERNGWIDIYVGDVRSRPVSERRSVLSPSNRIGFHYLSLHRTLIQQMGKPDAIISDELWQTICEMMRNRQ